jgi:hypothetical protein
MTDFVDRKDFRDRLERQQTLISRDVKDEPLRKLIMLFFDGVFRELNDMPFPATPSGKQTIGDDHYSHWHRFSNEECPYD